jgi:hypothetical protein
VRLGGVDIFHLVNDGEMRARGLCGNHCAFVVEVDGRLDPRRLDRRLAAATRALPELRWRLAGGWPVPPRWEVEGRGAPATVVHEATEVLDGALTLLEERLDGRQPWRLDVLRLPERDAAVLRWFHPLADARAAARLTAWLGSGDGDEPAAAPIGAIAGGSDAVLGTLDRQQRVALARAYTAHVMALGRVPTVSLADTVPERAWRGGRQRALRLVLDAEETRAFDRKVRQRARLAETSVALLAAVRVLDAELYARGLAPARHLVPVPLSLDPKDERARLFGNALTMMLFHLDRDDLGDERRAYLRLAEQQREIVRQRLDVAMLAGLDFAKWLPRQGYRWLRERPFAGAPSSMVVSNPGANEVRRFAGLEVRDAYPLPTVVAPPAFQLTFSRHAGRFAACMGWIEGVLAPPEAARAFARLRDELLA